RDVARMTLRISSDLPRKCDLAEHNGLAALRLDTGHGFALDLLELGGVERRLAKHLADQLQRRRERRTRRLDRRADIAGAGRRNGDLGLQFVERIRNLLPVE